MLVTPSARRARRADLADYLRKRPPPPGESIRTTARGFKTWVNFHCALDDITPYPMPLHVLIAELRAIRGNPEAATGRD